MVKLSKRMSKALRHDPGRIGLSLDSGGWVPVADLVTALGVDRSDVDAVVAGNDKQRFAIVRGPDGVERIRAIYAHAIAARYRFFSYGDSSLLLPGAVTGGR